MARPWLIKLTQSRLVWRDYLLLGRGEAQLGNGPRAREYLNRAKELLDKRGSPRDRKEAKAAFLEVEDWIKYYEWKSLSKPKVEKIVSAREKGASPPTGSPDVSAIRSASEGALKQQWREASGIAKPIEKLPASHPEYPVPVSFPFLMRFKEFQSAFSLPERDKALIDYTC
jgi:hypothetical protein